MHTLYPMSQPETPEAFRCRIYGTEDSDEAARVAFVERLAAEGVIDCPAYDGWVAALQARGWLPPRPELVPNPDGPGRIGRWKLTEHGRTEWAAMRDSARQLGG